jgi:phage baseplate assembly protein W
MAFGAKKIFPIDTQPGTAVGVDIPFNAPAVFKPNYTTQASIKNNLINFFLTNKNERYLNPIFGGNLRAFVFQQIAEGSIEYLKQDIQSQLGIYFSNVTVESLDVLSNTDNNQIDIILKYSIKDTGLTDTVQLAFI